MTDEQTILLQRRGLSGVGSFGRQRIIHALPPMTAQVHRHAWEIVFLAHGMQFRAHSGFNHPMHAGQVLIIPPGRRHSSGIMPQLPGTAYWLHLRNRGELLHLPKAEAAALRSALSSASETPFSLHPQARSHWEGAYALADTDRLTAMDRCRLRSLLLALLHDCLQPTAGTGQQADLIAKLMALITSDVALAAHPAVLARRVGLSYARLRARMKTATGQSLGDWLLRLRIHHAMRLLIAQPERPITDIALALDFSSSQYFATCFRRYAAMSPSRFRTESDTHAGQRRLRKLQDPHA